MHKPAIIAAILALVAVPACTAGQAPIGRSSQAVDELELEPSEIPPRRGELMPRVQGVFRRSLLGQRSSFPSLAWCSSMDEMATRSWTCRSTG